MKKSTLVRRLLVLALALTLILAALAGCGEQSAPAPDGGATPPADSAVSTAAATVATCGNETLDNLTLNYYYWVVFNSYYATYGGYIDLDTPLSQQYVFEGYSWQDLLVENAIDTWQGIACYVQEAAENNFTLSGQYQDVLAQVKDTLTSQAKSDGYADLDAYLKDAYGESASFDSFHQFLTDYYTAMAYRTEKLVSLKEQYAGETANTVDVRHILIQPDNPDDPASWQDALKRANEIYDQWKAEGTQEAFIALAAEHSQDPGSKDNGGLYEGVYPGQMVPSFNDWCFNPERQSGDTEIVATDYGYHIMYFVEVNDEPYTGYGDYLAEKTLAETDAALQEKYPVALFTENAVIYKENAR